jgi:putative PIN family toxin of toxin-antitoxin system
LGEKRREIARVVLDTNVIVSALLFEGAASALVGLWERRRIVPLVCAETLRELISVLAYPKFGLTEAEIRAMVNEDILPYIEAVKIKSEITGVSPDAADDIFLSCALNGKADVVVSGDAHLLRLREFEGIRMESLSAFLADHIR